ncbi:class I adenylate-forming enzyme family protein [Actinocorallia sp. A-T 12471]|uniref:class I adenylate-forming enzyme family protein n=1 Tax=Actinocorallia sp. A-T 12471 TaxID=3089813 RepID=UPI0029D09CD5|nr:class I adenylate-forming enzyme family protein [Actinocorallia sp. A-T 12471]MDX6742748.1 class I adenylate-forming enzyme family protein [Actinocorallia sp. A-T 12471]
MSGSTPTADPVTAALTAPGAPFEVVEATVRGRPTRVWRNAPATLADLMATANAWGELDYLVHGDERWTYAAHNRAAASLARWLAAGVVSPGDRVAIAASNRPAWSLAFWGAACAGAVVVPLNGWSSGEELQYALRDSGATVLFADAPRLARLAGRLHGVRVVVIDGSGAVEESAAEVRALAPLADPEAPFALPDIAIDTDDDATILYTSGTTGRPKGAVGTHRNITSNVMNLLFWGARAAGLAGASAVVPSGIQESTLVTVPLFHATGCHATLVSSMAQGGKLVLLNRFDAVEAVALLERERLTRLVGVPTTVMAVLDAAEGHDLTSVTYVGYGGSPAPPDLPARVRARMPNAVCGVGYGLTESSANATANMAGEYEDQPDSVGLPSPVIEISVVDGLGRRLPVGETGEIVVSGPGIVRGYWGRPKETAETFVDGSLRTGDIGRLDSRGRLYVSDRTKDMIIRGGENVYSAEVEHVLAEHPGVVEAAVVGRPHPLLGEEVAAFVRPLLQGGSELAGGGLAESVREHAAARLAAFKVPCVVLLHPEPLPRTATGKLRKDILRSALHGPVEEGVR